MFKFIVFWTVILTAVPAAVIACRVVKHAFHLMFFAMVVALVFPIEGSITFMSRSFYRMATTGFEIHCSDLAAIVLAFNIILRPDRYRFRWYFPPMTGMGIFLLISLISWSLSGDQLPRPDSARSGMSSPDEIELNFFEPYLYPLFEIFKMCRGFLFFWVTSHIVSTKKGLNTLIAAICASVLLMTVLALNQRYLMGFHRVNAGVGHYNDLNTLIGMMGIFIFPFAWQEKRFSIAHIYWVVASCGFLTIILTISRSSLAAYLLMMFLGSLFLIRRFPTTRNYVAAFIGLITVVGVLITAADTLIERFFEIESVEGSMVERTLLNRAAFMMAEDHVFGVGLGNFSAFSWHKYGALSGAPKGTPAHNIWYLVMAELGFPGLIMFFLIWINVGYLLIRGFISARIRREPLTYCLAVACGLSLFILHFQNWFHYTFRHMSVFLFTCMIIGAVSSLVLQAKRQALAYDHLTK